MKRNSIIVISIIIGVSIFFSVAYFSSVSYEIERCTNDTVYKDFTGEIVLRETCIFPFVGKKITDTFIGCDEGFKQINETCIQIKQDDFLEEDNLEQLASVFRSCEQHKIAIATNYTMPDGTKYRLTSEGYEYRNATHIIDSNICEWQIIEKYESDANLRNILDRCLNGNVGFTDEDFARWFNATHFIDTEECLMTKATHSGVSIDRTVYSIPFGSSEKDYKIDPIYIKNPNNPGELILDIDSMQQVIEILDYCTPPKNVFTIGLEYSNGTHYIDNNICEWQKIK